MPNKTLNNLIALCLATVLAFVGNLTADEISPAVYTDWSWEKEIFVPTGRDRGYAELFLGWYDDWLKGKDNGVTNMPKVITSCHGQGIGHRRTMASGGRGIYILLS